MPITSTITLTGVQFPRTRAEPRLNSCPRDSLNPRGLAILHPPVEVASAASQQSETRPPQTRTRTPPAPQGATDAAALPGVWAIMVVRQSGHRVPDPASLGHAARAVAAVFLRGHWVHQQSAGLSRISVLGTVHSWQYKGTGRSCRYPSWSERVFCAVARPESQ